MELYFLGIAAALFVIFGMGVAVAQLTGPRDDSLGPIANILSIITPVLICGLLALMLVMGIPNFLV